MTNTVEKIFSNKQINIKKLSDYGFKKVGDDFVYCTVLPVSGFSLEVTITGNTVKTFVYDNESDQPYTLHLADCAVGSFVGSVRTDYENKLIEIADFCCETEIYKFSQTKRIFDYAITAFGCAPEFLWGESEETAVLRRCDNKKWFAVFMKIPKSKLGNYENEQVEIMNFHILPDNLDTICDGIKFFRGYHMNKKHWCTVILDESLSDKELFAFLKVSFDLAVKK